MDKLSSIQIFLGRVADILQIAGRFIVNLILLLRNWLAVRIPLIRALLKRHADNPSTVFVDIAIFIVSLYVIFGVIGYVDVYPRHSESRIAEKLAGLYPLPAAKVNSTFVWSHKFLERLRFLNTFNAKAPKDGLAKAPTDKDLRQRVMEGLIEDQIIVLEAKKRGIRVTESELNQALDRQGKRDEIKQKIKELYGMSLSQFKEIIAEQVLKEKVKNSVLTKVRVRHILTSTQQSANDAKRQLDAGTDFAEVAKTYSQDAKTKDAGGDLGFWYKGELSTQISPAFEESAFSLELNKVSVPVQSAYGFHLIQITEKSGDNLQTYDEWYKQTAEKYKIHRYIRI